jgi:transposase-like protein
MNVQGYPETLQEAILYFSDAQVCHDFMVNMRWPNGVTCPRCGCEDVRYSQTKGAKPRRLWNCYGCKKQFTVKVGTIFEDSPLGMEKWLPAVWIIVNAKNGVSSHELGRSLGVTQKTAWFMLHRIRLALQVGSFDKMSGTIEADETFIGGKASNMHKSKRIAKIQGRGTVGKTAVLGLLERDSKTGKPKRVVAQVVPDTGAETLQGAIHEKGEAGSEIHTDAWKAYRGLTPDYFHFFVDHAIAYAEGHVTTNGLENFWSLLKRSIKGTYTHVEPYHLFRYLDEQAWRYNKRKMKDGDRFVEALRFVTGRRLTYQQVTGKTLF